MSKLDKLSARFEHARADLNEELLRIYPAGSTVQFTIRHGQKSFSTGTVCGVGYSAGTIRVDHHQAKPNGRYRYRDVHYKYQSLSASS